MAVAKSKAKAKKKAKSKAHPPAPPSKGDQEGAAELIVESLKETRADVKHKFSAMGVDYHAALEEMCKALRAWHGTLGPGESWLDVLESRAAFQRSTPAKGLIEEHGDLDFEGLFCAAVLSLHEGALAAAADGHQGELSGTESTPSLVGDDGLREWLNSAGTVRLRSFLKHLESIALDKDELPQLSHVLLHSERGATYATALDGKRCARVRIGDTEVKPGFRCAVRAYDLKLLCGALKGKDEDDGAYITVEGEPGTAVGKMFTVEDTLMRMDVMRSPEGTIETVDVAAIIAGAMERPGNRRYAVDPFLLGELLLKMALSCGMKKGGYHEPCWLEVPEDRSAPLGIRMCNTSGKVTCDGAIMPIRTGDDD